MLTVTFQEDHHTSGIALGFICFEGPHNQAVLSEDAQAFDKAHDGFLTHHLGKNRFTGKKNEVLCLTSPSTIPESRVVLIGLGKAEEVTVKTLEHAGGTLVAALRKTPDEALKIALKKTSLSLWNAQKIGAHLAFGAQLRHWRFALYRTQEKPHQKPALRTLNILVPSPEEAQKIYGPLEHLAQGICFARHLTSEPGNVLYPASYAERLQELKKLGVGIEVLDKTALQKLGMNALLGVAQGSAQEGKVVVLTWTGGGADQKPIAFVGKGVTFDTGGISLKPSANMEDMKYDMGGSAVIAGLFKALAGRQAKVNVVGVLGLVENMPSGTAQRPGDVVTSLSGQTIEILNTDAEGRLVLADALWYTQDRFKPRMMIDLATLTGAIVVALGSHYAGLFSNDEVLSQQLSKAGEITGERVWRMPLDEKYDQEINSEVADVKNLGESGKAGSIAAAQFLARFVNNVPWAHLDIAGVAWSKKGLQIAEKGATGFGVHLLNQFLQDYYE